MPLSTVCVSIVSNRPNRNWSSSNDVQRIFIMNSTEDIASYKAPSFHSPNFHRRTLGCSYDFPDKSYKKDKKWSIANIFRRKKKEESDTSSEEDAQKKGFLARRKKKSDNKRKKPAKNAPFDHVVAVRSPPGSRNSISYIGNCRNEESAVMSDPACIPSYIDKTQNFNQNHQQHSESFSGSVDSVRKSRRELTMARAEARRNSSKNGSSSEDESHQSNSSVVIQSEEHLDRPFSKKSRAARTERYLKRHSKDGENPHNYLRIYKSEYSDESNRSLSRSPLIPRTVSPADTKHKLSYSSLNSQSSNLSGLSTIPQPHAKFRVSNSTSNPNYKPPQSMNEYHNSMKKYANKFTNGQRSYSCDDNIHTSDILHVQFPVVRPKRGFRNLSLIDTSQLRHPPPPPPRDPNRTVLPESRPNTCYFDQSGPKAYQHRNTFSCRSTSEDHLPRSTLNVPLEIRPSSTTPESNQRFIIKHDEPVIKSVKEEYNYLTDKKPRSRKPIFIQSGNKIANSNLKENESTNKALNFWKQIDLQSSANNRKSPQMFSSHTQVQTKIFLPDKPINPVTLTPAPSLDTVTKEDIKRKSSNLEEALNELEAIYNSLKLGDEDLLDRAEQKEKEALTKKLESSKTYPSSISKGALSDSSYSYEPFDTVDSPRRKRFSKKTHNLKLDDMAFRKINKNRSNTIGDPQSVVSQVSYLMRSPVFSRNHLADNQKNNTNEPDVTLDDVVYRNVKHSNSLLKVAEPQPPFGIPLGPITPGANSDYLHAKPELVYKPVFKRKKIPDIVKDDLAFRNLRKDSNKEPALPPLSNDDFTNNSEENLKYLKKKRAQRSMSANIGNILSGNARDKIDVDNHFKTLTDIADAMEIARKVLKEKENKISLTKKAFMSDTDASYDNAKERLNFLNELRGKPPLLGDSLACKPPRGLTPERRRSPKESTPIPVSPLEDKRCESTHSSLDELLNALAEEAKETTERITKELKELSEDKENIFNKQSVSRRLTEIDQVAEKARLLENVVDSTPLITVLKNCEEEFDEEEVKSIYEEPPPAESATIVMSRYECKDSSSRSNDSEHDYENLSSDMEAALKISDTDKDRCLSPFEERKAELVATFQELKTDNKEDINETGTDQHPIRRPRLFDWPRYLHGNLHHLNMSENQESRLERIARYKEERRKQLNEQFASYRAPSKTTRTTAKDGNSSHSSDSPRPTITSKLRAAATSKSSPNDSNECDTKVGSKRIERDKSNKRKSNLNRSLNSEEVPSSEGCTAGDVKVRRRRRRFFPAEVFESSGNDANASSTASLTASSPSTAASTSTLSPRTSHRKSELSEHMENARKNVIAPPVADTGKYKPYKYKSSVKSNESMRFSPKSSSSRLSDLSSSSQRMIASDDEKYKAVAGRMEGLAKQSSARVEKSTSKSIESKAGNQKSLRNSKDKLCSILKKNSADEIPSIVVDNPVLPCASTTVVGPVSILKRKASQDNKLEHPHSNNTPPVTFSPSVLEPSTNRRKQGILKKRRSLDESTVLRHRSCSPDVANKTDSRSILKNQRRSSLEELRRTRSPETHLHGILKHRPAKYDYEDHSLNSPQSILKRRSGASSASSTGGGGSGSPHVSITTAVILAAAGGAEMVLNSDGESVRPILKKKSFSEEHSHCNDGASDAPKPILKKKSSTDTDESEEKRRPILKLPRSSLEFDALESNDSKAASETECDVTVRPILKQSVGREEPTRRLSFRSSTESDRWSRRSHTISSDFEIESLKMKRRDEDGLSKPRPFSVSELVKSFERGGSTGAVPKKNNNKRAGSRYKTQPVTFNELEASRNLVKSPQRFDDDRGAVERRCDARSLLDFSSSLGRNAGQVKGFLASSMRCQRSPESVAGEKMSSDSAFQSLGDGLELEQVEESTQSSDVDKNNGEDNSEPSDVTNSRNQYYSRRYSSSAQILSQSVTIEEIKTASKISSKDESTFSETRAQSKSANRDKSCMGLSPDKDDEGISCNDSDSSSDSDTTPKVRSHNDSWRMDEAQTKPGCDSTSDGESSGGREIKSIFKNDNILKIKQTLEGGSLKIRSQESFDDDSDLHVKSLRSNMPQVIADITAKLQTFGESEWKKRLSSHNSFNDELKMLKDEVSSKKIQLDAALTNWKNRVEKSDAEKFSVAGKMSKSQHVPVRVNLPSSLETKSPHQKKFKLKQGSDSASTSPERNSSALIRSQSLSFSTKFNSTDYTKKIEDSSSITKKSVTVLNPDDITMQKFFKTYDQVHHQADVSLADFDAVERQSLLVIRKNVQVRKRKTASNNPIKALASRSDISNEYTEILTGVAEREKKRLNIEKLAKNSDKALDALAGLASNEDFKAVALKKSSAQIGPWKDVMLLQIKGRRHVQTRLVEPVADSINEGDNYILITPSAYYTYTGTHSNVIEQSRMSDIVNHILKTGDMGCKGKSVYAVNALNKTSKHTVDFWSHLGAEGAPNVAKAGHCNEDETYESNVLLTNMIYALDNDELVPCDPYWGGIPKFEMLKDTDIYVFDFGAEMYVWSGKNAPSIQKKLALKVAREMWSEGYDYTDCGFCPVNVASVLGDRERDKLPLQGNRRPDWALFAKLTQHGETILFKEKFLDWPDFSRIIQVKGNDNADKTNGSVDVRPCDVDEMLNNENKLPDLIAENVHMGRGDQYFDEETRRLFAFDTLNVTGWRILEHSHEKLTKNALGTFYDGDSYIYKWDFRQTVRGRELNGNPSKHAAVGRDRCIFFYWQGCNSSIKEKGVAALLTVELDKENAPQIRVAQGAEPAAFLRLFGGQMVVHRGKRSVDDVKSRLFILRGEKEDEMYLMEVNLDVGSLRSKSSFVLFDNNNRAFIWHGAKSKPLKRKGIKKAVEKYTQNEKVKVTETIEGSETEDFWRVLGNDDRTLYHSLLESNESFDHTIRLFNMCSLTGEFSASEILCPHRSEHCTPYPFVQSDLYSASQPALFLIDNDHELWLWQGYLPERHLEEDAADQIVSVRWQAERKAAMQTAVEYWKKKRGGERMKAYQTSAGSEPVNFTNLFPAWDVRTDIVELNKKTGKPEGEMVPIEHELTLLSRTTYPLSELLQRPLPEGVDPTNIEKYLSAEDFEVLLSMSKEEFDRLPSWKKTVIKKEKGLF